MTRDERYELIVSTYHKKSYSDWRWYLP